HRKLWILGGAILAATSGCEKESNNVTNPAVTVIATSPPTLTATPSGATPTSNPFPPTPTTGTPRPTPLPPRSHSPTPVPSVPPPSAATPPPPPPHGAPRPPTPAPAPHADPFGHAVYFAGAHLHADLLHTDSNLLHPDLDFSDDHSHSLSDCALSVKSEEARRLASVAELAEDAREILSFGKNGFGRVDQKTRFPNSTVPVSIGPSHSGQDCRVTSLQRSGVNSFGVLETRGL